MNKTFFLSWLVIFVLWMMGSFVIHGMLLHGDYTALPQLFRSEEDSAQYFHWMLLAHVMLAGAFSWIYRQGIRRHGWLGQGIRFGIAIALMGVVPTYTIYYAVQPMPGAIVIKQIVFDGGLVVLLGVAVAFLHRKQAH